jgi:hypothetical protein
MRDATIVVPGDRLTRKDERRLTVGVAMIGA